MAVCAESRATVTCQDENGPRHKSAGQAYVGVPPTAKHVPRVCGATAGQGEGDLLVGLAFEESLKDLCGGDGVEAFGRILPRKLGGCELFPGSEAA